MAGIDNDGIKWGCSPDVGGSENWIHQFSQINPGDEVASLEWQDLEAEYEFHVVHEDFLTADGEPDFDSPVFQLEEWALDLHGLEAVEFLYATSSDVFLTFVAYRLPASGGGEGGEQDSSQNKKEHMAERSGEEAHLGERPLIDRHGCLAVSPVFGEKIGGKEIFPQIERLLDRRGQVFYGFLLL